MEYLRGQILKQRIQEKALTTEAILDFGIQTVDARDAAHSEGIIHRDWAKSYDLSRCKEGDFNPLR